MFLRLTYDISFRYTIRFDICYEMITIILLNFCHHGNFFLEQYWCSLVLELIFIQNNQKEVKCSHLSKNGFLWFVVVFEAKLRFSGLKLFLSGSLLISLSFSLTSGQRERITCIVVVGGRLFCTHTVLLCWLLLTSFWDAAYLLFAS